MLSVHMPELAELDGLYTMVSSYDGFPVYLQPLAHVYLYYVRAQARWFVSLDIGSTTATLAYSEARAPSPDLIDTTQSPWHVSSAGFLVRDPEAAVECTCGEYCAQCSELGVPGACTQCQSVAFLVNGTCQRDACNSVHMTVDDSQPALDAAWAPALGNYARIGDTSIFAQEDGSFLLYRDNDGLWAIGTTLTSKIIRNPIRSNFPGFTT